jgi:hypothetical protein
MAPCEPLAQSYNHQRNKIDLGLIIVSIELRGNGVKEQKSSIAPSFYGRPVRPGNNMAIGIS